MPARDDDGDVLEAARAALGTVLPLRIEPIGEGASARKYFRATLAGDRTVIICRHRGRSEDLAFGPAARFLATLGVPVPVVLREDPVGLHMVIEDLGDLDLRRAAPALDHAGAAAILREVLEAIAPLHRVEGGGSPAPSWPLPRPFDVGLYLWESGFFEDRFLAGLAEIRPAGPRAEEWIRERRSAADELAALPRRLIHRDLQSSNVILRGGRPFLIDFQGIRWGLPEYDLASLLLDPYVTWATEVRRPVEEAFFAMHPARKAPSHARAFVLCACQRLMQALGVYADAALGRGDFRFLPCIPAALNRLREAARSGGLPVLEGLAEEGLRWAERSLPSSPIQPGAG